MRTNMTENKIQAIADKMTDSIMSHIFGQEYNNCKDITENTEMSEEWEFLNETFFNILAKEFKIY